MKLYLAGNSQYSGVWEYIAREHEKALLSYHYLENEDKPFWQKTLIKMKDANNKVNLFLDSGAFSAKTQGVEINIEEYIQFIKDHQQYLEVYANLDVIGDPAGTWKNQMIMEAEGLKPLPVFHHGEDLKWLHRYLNRGYDYIALGGMVKTSNLSMWLDDLFLNHLCDPNGIPKVKIHAFGMTSLKLMIRYPWYSVDSTSWVVTGRLGAIYVPRFRNGVWIYDENSWKIAVSNKSPTTKDAGKHITTLSPKQREIIMHYVHDKGFVFGKSLYKTEKLPYDLEDNEKWVDKKIVGQITREVEIIKEAGISNMYQLRDEINIQYFMDLEKSMPEWPWSFKKTEVLNGFF